VLKGYRQCAHKVRLQYVDRVAIPYQFNAFLAAGRIAHTILARNAHHARLDKPFLDRDWTFQRAFNQLPAREFPSNDERAAWARDITDWVAYGLSAIDRKATFINIERPGKHAGHVDGERFQFEGRPDLVMLRADEYGELVIDFIDYKTGAIWPDDIAASLVRRVIHKDLGAFAGDTASVRMRWIWVWLKHREHTIVEMDRDWVTSRWREVMTDVRGLIHETTWPANPGHLCNYCPYLDTIHCTAEIPPKR
jgi:hypothetical protein